jgi:hypothetical protein
MRTKRLVILVLTLVGLVALGFGVRAYLAHEARAEPRKDGGPSGGKPSGKEGGGGPDRVVPVVAAKVEARDVPIYLERLGTVATFNIVTVKSQVESRIDKIAFQEGQIVHRGELLAQAACQEASASPPPHPPNAREDRAQTRCDVKTTHWSTKSTEAGRRRWIWFTSGQRTCGAPRRGWPRRPRALARSWWARRADRFRRHECTPAC